MLFHLKERLNISPKADNLHERAVARLQGESK